MLPNYWIKRQDNIGHWTDFIDVGKYDMMYWINGKLFHFPCELGFAARLKVIEFQQQS